MNSKLKSVLLLAVPLLAAPLASAQLTLQNFSAFETLNTFFIGSWELTGDPIGTNSPRATFSQGAGVYNFVGGTNDDTSSVFYFFAAPLNLTGLSLLEVSAQTLQGNTAASFTLSLFDSLGESATATFATSAFAGPGYTTVQTALTFSAGFDKTDLSSFLLSGNEVGGTATFNVSFNNLAVVAPAVVVAVPEPATYGVTAALLLVGLTVFSRRKSKRSLA